MSDEPHAVPRFDWRPLRRPGCRGVETRLLLARDELVLAMLRFKPGATIDEHAADHPVDVVCLEGSGFISLQGRTHRFTAGQSMIWPPGQLHRLWTDRHDMLTLIAERP
jgi:quercetin dioxygenase-like cupin family protein